MSKFYDRCGNKKPFSLIAGPCVFESTEHAKMMAGSIQLICDALGINFIYKTSFDKANRTSMASDRGQGFDAAWYGFQSLKQAGFQILTDVHEDWQCDAIAPVVDILQIPAFLCRQTNLLKAAVETGLPVNVKKGQFLSPREMIQVAKKIEVLNDEAKFPETKLLLTERGTTFGYNNLVVDMRSLAIMQSTNYPVIMDCTHAVQSPGGLGGSSGGDREMAKVLARAAIGVGVAGIFMEVHQDPDNAPSDGPNMIKLCDLKPLLEDLWEIDMLRKSQMTK